MKIIKRVPDDVSPQSTDAGWVETLRPRAYDLLRRLSQYHNNDTVDLTLTSDGEWRSRLARDDRPTLGQASSLVRYGYIACVRFEHDLYSEWKVTEAGVGRASLVRKVDHFVPCEDWMSPLRPSTYPQPPWPRPEVGNDAWRARHDEEILRLMALKATQPYILRYLGLRQREKTVIRDVLTEYAPEVSRGGRKLKDYPYDPRWLAVYDEYFPHSPRQYGDLLIEDPELIDLLSPEMIRDPMKMTEEYITEHVAHTRLREENYELWARTNESQER